MSDEDEGIGNAETPIEIINLDSEGDATISTATVLGSDSQAGQPQKRETWGSKLGYLLTLIGYAVGFGNFWRFPYMMRENGGLAFLIPYFIMLATIGIPTFFLELAVGQRRRKGIVYTWKDISPYLGGLGICCGWLCFFVGLYYNTLLAWCISYLADSIFYSPLPWANCKQIAETYKIGSTNECETFLGKKAAKYYWYRGTLQASGGVDEPGRFNWAMAGYLFAAWSTIWLILCKGTESVEAVVYFTAGAPYIVLVTFFILNFVQDGHSAALGAYRLVQPQWNVLKEPITWLKAGSQIFFSLGLGMGCLVVFASYSAPNNNCYRDAVAISFINCGTSLFAAMVVFPMIGAFGFRQWKDCKKHMKTVLPHLKLWNSKHKDNFYDLYFTAIPYGAKIWSDVEKVEARWGYGENKGKTAKEFSQTNPTYLSVPKSEFNSTIDAKAVTAVVLKNCSIGELATESGSGTGFVFMGFTEAVLNTEWSNVFALMFFIMLLTLGIDSGFGTVEGAVNAFEDIFRLKRWISTTIVVGILTVIAVGTFAFGWGVYVLDLLDQWTANWTLLLIALAEFIGVAWVYGLAQMAYDVRLMTGNKPNMYILISWKYVSPIMILMVLIGSITTFIISNKEGIKYNVFRPNESWRKDKDLDGEVIKDFPAHSLAVGFVIMFFCILWIPLQAALCKTKLSLVRHDGPCDFPEETLRRKRGINVMREEEQFTAAEKKIMGSHSLHSLQEYRDKKRKASKHSKKKHNSPERKRSAQSLV